MIQSNRLRSVLITGASSGIGLACAQWLANRKWRVFAGVRNLNDFERLQALGPAELLPVMLDVTNAESLRRAVAYVANRCGDSGLDALVNNAGIGKGGPQEAMPLDIWREVFDVNVFGVVATTQSFLPLLRHARKPRIVNVGSIYGLVSMPFIAPYCASKHALEAITSSLRVELHPDRIPVTMIQPGNIRTAIWEKADHQTEGVIRFVRQTGHARYVRPLEIIADQGIAEGRAGIDAQDVARVVERALTDRRPQTSYRIGRDARRLAWGRWLLPTRWLEYLIRRHFGLHNFVPDARSVAEQVHDELSTVPLDLQRQATRPIPERHPSDTDSATSTTSFSPEP